METFYFGNIKVSIEKVKEDESRVYFNGDLAMWIKNSDKEDFISSITNTVTKFRI